MTTTLRLDYIQIDRLLCSAGSEGGCHACYILLYFVYLGHARTHDNHLQNLHCRPHGVKVVCLVSHPSGGSSELACAMRINLVIQIILAC